MIKPSHLDVYSVLCDKVNAVFLVFQAFDRRTKDLFGFHSSDHQHRTDVLLKRWINRCTQMIRAFGSTR